MPIKFIIYIKKPPNNELKINFIIFFIGQINILANMNINTIHAKKVMTELKSKLITSTKICLLIFMIKFGQIWLLKIKLYFFLYKFDLSYLVQYPFFELSS